MMKISPRFRWMVEMLPLDSGNRVLEVGYGHGVALGLIGEQLTTGTVTGVDRHHSPNMISTARKRNAALVEAGRVQLRTASLHEMDDEPGSFDLICAMNHPGSWHRSGHNRLATSGPADVYSRLMDRSACSPSSRTGPRGHLPGWTT